MKTLTQTLAAALRILSQDIESPDGVANAAIAEAAERLEELAAQVEMLRIAALNAVQTMSGGKVKADLRDAYDAAPTQCLREIQAIHFEKGFIQGVRFIGTGFVSESDYEEAKAYGDRIRNGGE